MTSRITPLPLLANLALRRPRNVDVPRLGRDAVAGVISAVVQVAYCISFAALIFTGDLAGGFSLGLAGLIMGTVVTCIVIAVTSTFSPTIGGPDSPAVAVMSVLAASIAAALASKGASHEQIALNVLVALSVSTLLTGVLLYGVGALKLGQWLRFIPYPVIGGFLVASGILLILGGMEVVTQTDLSLSPESWEPLYSTLYGPQIAIGALFAIAIPLLARVVPVYLALPVAFFGFVAVLDVALLFVVSDETVRNAWFLPSLGELTLWWPLGVVFGTEIDWGVIAMSAAEIGSFCGVMAIALLLDVSSLEVARQKGGDLDQEFRSNGLANLLSSVLGGFGGSLSMNGSILLDESGATTRWAGAIVGIVCAIVLFSGTDVGSVVPKAILGGMLAYLGAVIIVELLDTPAESTWTEWALTGVMTLVIINFGYFTGVVIGVIGACLMFAMNYSRIGVVRRHLTRYEFSSNVERSPEQSRLLHEEGKRVHVFWLSGFIFFGSSNGLFERIKRVIEEQQERPVGYVVLDFSGVPGFDSSAVLSLVKLRNYCEEHDVTLAFSGLNDSMRASFERAGFFGSEKPHQVFGSRNEAVEWCEDMVLLYHEVGDASAHNFETWLHNEFGGQIDFERIAPFMERQELDSGAFLFKQGEPSDSVVFQASGCVAITITDEHGRSIRLRRMIGHTVVGEMGFYRHVPRTANVVAEAPTVVYRLTQEAFDRMQEKDSAAAAALHKLIIRLLSDRLEFANREISALL
ncbi:MAG: SulP family inorganic anion transporter [Methyloceanibacter sp.]|uniref:SulP family inorganic anion transporter n=1 Tax=Methyloceanibacter sp. TaxID=1965321 RepID=UPI003EE42043